MRFICVAFILLLVLMTSAQCQQTAEDWFNKGIALLGQGKYDEGIKAYDEAIRLDPKFAMAWNNKGLALFGQGKYDEAIKALDEAIRLDPTYVYPWIGKGNVLKLLGRTSEADAAFAKAKELGYAG
jgi:tetratricopeptide (TPR) repeat protein